MSESKRYIKIWLTLEHDQDLVDWWDSLPKGERSKIGRDILRAHKDNSSPLQQQQIDLGDIRQIFEMVLDSKLSNLSLVQQPHNDSEEQESGAEDSETTNLLNDMLGGFQ